MLPFNFLGTKGCRKASFLYISYTKIEEIHDNKRQEHNLWIISIYQHPLKYEARPETLANVQILFNSAERKDMELVITNSQYCHLCFLTNPQTLWNTRKRKSVLCKHSQNNYDKVGSLEWVTGMSPLMKDEHATVRQGEWQAHQCLTVLFNAWQSALVTVRKVAHRSNNRIRTLSYPPAGSYHHQQEHNSFSPCSDSRVSRKFRAAGSMSYFPTTFSFIWIKSLPPIISLTTSLKVFLSTSVSDSFV